MEMASLAEDFADLKKAVEDTSVDVERAGEGNKAAGTRVRKAMQAIKHQAQVVRQNVLKMREE